MGSHASRRSGQRRWGRQIAEAQVHRVNVNTERNVERAAVVKEELVEMVPME